MQIDLPQDIIERVHNLASLGSGESEADVIRKALDLLDWHVQERIAIQEGIDAWRAGIVQDLGDFDHEFRKQNGISAEL